LGGHFPVTPVQEQGTKQSGTLHDLPAIEHEEMSVSLALSARLIGISGPGGSRKHRVMGGRGQWYDQLTMGRRDANGELSERRVKYSGKADFDGKWRAASFLQSEYGIRN